MTNRPANIEDASNCRLSAKRVSTSRRFVMAGTLVSVLAIGSFAQPVDMMVVGGQALRVGMSREEAIAKLRVCCELTGGGDSFFIQSKTGPPFELLGGIWFSQGRVSRIRPDRSYSDDREVAGFGLALFRITSELTQSGPSQAVIGTATTELSNGTERTITIQFANGRVLTVSALNPDKGSAAVQVSEELSTR